MKTTIIGFDYPLLITFAPSPPGPIPSLREANLLSNLVVGILCVANYTSEQPFLTLLLASLHFVTEANAHIYNSIACAAIDFTHI